MFGLPGFADVLAVACAGIISIPLFLKPRWRRGRALVAHRFDIERNTRPAVSIEGRRSGLIPRMLRLIGLRSETTFEVTDECITVHAAGLARGRRTEVPLAQVATARCGVSKPLWHLSAAGVVIMVLSVWAGAGRLTPDALAAGVAIAGLCTIASTLQRTVDLIVETTSGTTIVLSFMTTPSAQPVMLHDVKRAAGRINDLATQRQRV